MPQGYNNLSNGVAELVSALTGGGAAVQARARTAEEARMIQAQQERALLAERAAKAAEAVAGNRDADLIRSQYPGAGGAIIVGNHGPSFKAFREGEGVEVKNLARQLAMIEAEKAAPGPDLQNAYTSVSSGTLLGPDNVQVMPQADANIGKARAAEFASRASANSSNSTAALTNAKIPFVDDLARGEIDLNAAQLANVLQSGRLTAAKAGATAPGSVKSKADVFASSALTALDQLDVLDADGVGGPIAGRITPAWGPGGQQIEQYDTLAASLRADLQRLQRVPGVGAQSDRELAELIKASQSVGQNPETRQVISALIRRKLTELGARNWDAGDAAPGVPGANTGPAPGTVADGFRFKGGNPNDPTSWEPTQ